MSRKGSTNVTARGNYEPYSTANRRNVYQAVNVLHLSPEGGTRSMEPSPDIHVSCRDASSCKPLNSSFPQDAHGDLIPTTQDTNGPHPSTESDAELGDMNPYDHLKHGMLVKSRHDVVKQKNGGRAVKLGNPSLPHEDPTQAISVISDAFDDENNLAPEYAYVQTEVGMPMGLTYDMKENENQPGVYTSIDKTKKGLLRFKMVPETDSIKKQSPIRCEDYGLDTTNPHDRLERMKPVELHTDAFKQDDSPSDQDSSAKENVESESRNLYQTNKNGNGSVDNLHQGLSSQKRQGDDGDTGDFHQDEVSKPRDPVYFVLTNP